MAGKPSLTTEYETNSHRSELAAYVLIAGLAIELAFAFFLDGPWLEKVSTIVADVLIVVGVWGEIHFGRKARESGDKLLAESEVRISEANERAANAELELGRIRARIAPRALTKEQKEILQSLKGKISAVSVVYHADAEPEKFADGIIFALIEVGIVVNSHRAAAGINWTGIWLFTPGGSGNAPSTFVPQALREAFLKAGLLAFGVVTSIDLHVFDGFPQGIPLISIGQKPDIISPAEPGTTEK
jgi:hypothetical protein